MKLILIADDTWTVREMYVDFLADTYQVVQARDGKEALEVLARGPLPALVVSDIEMPGLWGDDVCTEVQKLYPGLPVILISGRSDVAGIAQACGADGYLEKPVRQEKLLAMIAGLIAGRPED